MGACGLGPEFLGSSRYSISNPGKLSVHRRPTHPQHQLPRYLSTATFYPQHPWSPQSLMLRFGGKKNFQYSRSTYKRTFLPISSLRNLSINRDFLPTPSHPNSLPQHPTLRTVKPQHPRNVPPAQPPLPRSGRTGRHCKARVMSDRVSFMSLQGPLTDDRSCQGRK